MRSNEETSIDQGTSPDAGQVLFPLLAKRGMARTWACDADPIAGVGAECRALARDMTFMSSFRTFLDANPIIEASCASMLAQLALAAGVRWRDTAPILQPLSRRGWHIGRWLPTFLLISGPLGHLLRGGASPLNQRLRGKNAGLPLLSEARDVFDNDEFRLLRNGFGHWSFEWNDTLPVAEVH